MSKEKIRNIDIIVPIKNEADNVVELIERVDKTFSTIDTDYTLVFVDDHSTDDTISILKTLSKSFPIRIQIKNGKGGKGYSILEGVEESKAEVVGFIDGDNQYPAEVFPEMLEKLTENVGVVTVRRQKHKTGKSRTLGSKLNALIIGKYLLGMNHDIQAGMKVFRRDLAKHINKKHVTNWTFDIPLLYAAKQLGYEIKDVDITFEERGGGKSKVGFLRTALAIITCALKTKFSSRRVYQIGHEDENVALGAGVVYKEGQFVTHTRLPHHKSALYTFQRAQKVFFLVLFGAGITGLILRPLETLSAIIAVLSAIYFLDVLFTLYIILKSLKFPPELSFSDEEISNINDEDLPVYSILCPLFKEKQILPYFVDAISKMDWPKDKLDVLLLLEEVDEETIEAAREMNLPEYFRIIVVPHSNPQTKPKACNYGLHLSKGKYVVIYDAEDVPDVKQLKKAHLAFEQLPEDILCVQAKLNYFNPNQNLLTKLFTAEYSLWFDIVLPGLQSIETTIPLGGTSNHFKTKNLVELHGWDPFNVTEDCDLGARIFKDGYKTALIDSTTYEEANSNVRNWIRQRSRWIKGYWQTYLVHMRNPLSFLMSHRSHAILFQLIIGLRTTFILINPILWALTFAYFALYQYVGPTIEALYPTYVFYMAVFSLVFGNFMYVYNYMLGLAKRKTWWAIKYVFFIPFYWFMTSIAAAMAFYQLVVKPHYWEKTQHGLHLEDEDDESDNTPDGIQESKAVTKKQKVESIVSADVASRTNTAKKLIKNGAGAGGLLISANFLANGLNYIYNAYLSRAVSIEDFGLISLYSSLLFLSTIPQHALARTVTYRSAFHLGKHNDFATGFWKFIRSKAFLFAAVLTGVWILLIPFLKDFFQSPSYIPFIFFTPLWAIGFLSAVDQGYLGGNQKFKVLALLVSIDASIKLLITYIIVESGYPEYVYAAIPAALATSFMVGYFFAKRLKGNATSETESVTQALGEFPKKFFFSALASKFSIVAFLSFDVILAKIFLSPTDAGQYALIALIGKIIFFVSWMFGQFVTPIISKKEGESINSKSAFYLLFGLSAVCGGLVYTAVGIFGAYTGPLLFGDKVNAISQYLPLYGIGMLYFALSVNIVIFQQIRERYIYPTMSFILALTQIIGIALYHDTLLQVVTVMTVIGTLNLLMTLMIYTSKGFFIAVQRNIIDLSGLFRPLPFSLGGSTNGKRILIYNWRDTKHKWHGGAEVYIHEISKQLVNEGNEVVVFCGNDHYSSDYEEYDGVRVVRKGGFFTVYPMAFLYYTLRFRGKFDVIIDSENGIPFFTPMFAKEPVIGIVHHVHKDIILGKLKLPKLLIPFAFAARLLESRLMPYVYRNSKMITVSESTRGDMKQMGLGKNLEIDIVHPGIDPDTFCKTKKTEEPTILYLGRLKPYKSIDVVINAMETIVKSFPNAKFKIAGFGESRTKLEKLAKKLHLENNIEFLGRVTEDDKVKLMGEAWVFVYPSSKEGWGMAVIEANACGTPVVAANVPGLRDSVRNPTTGLLAEHGDATDFAKNILDIIENKDLRTKLEQGSLSWAENFTWKNSGKKLSKIIDTLPNKA